MTYDDYPYKMMSYHHTDAKIAHAEHLLTTVVIPNIEPSQCEESCQANPECKAATWTVDEEVADATDATDTCQPPPPSKSQCAQQIKSPSVQMEHVDVALSDTQRRSTSFVKPACHDACLECAKWMHDGRCIDTPGSESGALDCRMCDTAMSASATCLVDLAIPNGKPAPCSQRLARGQTCEPTCDDGYELTGRYECKSDGTVGDPPACHPKSCDASASPENGGPGNCTSRLGSGEECVPSCDVGYSIEGATKCTHGRLESTAKCVPSDCAIKMEDIPNATKGTCEDTLKHGQSCQPKCDRLFASSGPTTCDRGVLRATTCVASACDISSVVTEHSVDPGDCPTDALVSGESCAPVCEDGYTLTISMKCDSGKLRPATCEPSSSGARRRRSMDAQMMGAEKACDASRPPANGKLGDCTDQLAHGQSCQPTCDEGFVSTGPTTCESGQLRSTTTCKPRVCVVTAPEKGGLGTCSAVMKHGDVCQPTCAKGFEVSGENRCVNGTIDEPVTCKPARCTLSAPPSNGSVGKCPPTLQHGESCSPACDDGYEPATDDSSLRCDHGALSEFTCRPKDCVVKPDCTLYDVGACPPTLKHGESCEPACNHGYVLARPLACSLGTLSEDVCKPKACKVPPVVNGTVDCPESLLHGQSCDVTCDTGYERDGGLVRCDAGVLTSPVCRRKVCAPLAEHNAPAHGALGCGLGRRLEHDETFEPTCDAGYTLSEPIRCVDGALSLAECRPNECDVSQATVDNGSVSCDDVVDASWVEHGQQCHVECNDGYELVGELTCNAGQWTRPICRHMVCAVLSDDTHAIENGRSGACENVTLKHGEQCNPACDVGYRLVRPFSCADGTLTSAACEVKQCTLSDETMDEHYLDLGDCDAQMSHSASCNPTCERGYSLASPLQCWDGRLVKGDCVPNACVVSIPENASAGTCSAETLGHGESCRPTCDPGYTLHGETECAYGKLTSATCKPSACELDSTSISCHGDVGDCPSTLQHGQSCQPTCNAGYTPTGSLLCNKGAFVAPVDCLPNSCDASTPPANGAVGDCTSRLASGKYCAPQCDDGYELTKYTSCKLGVLDPAKCVPMACSVNTPPDGGNLGACPSTLEHGQTCNFECDDGYRLVGDTSCSFGALTEGVCVPSPCDSITGPVNGSMGNCTPSLAHGETCVPTCDVGFSRKGVTYCNYGVASIASCEPSASNPRRSSGNRALSAFFFRN